MTSSVGSFHQQRSRAFGEPGLGHGIPRPATLKTASLTGQLLDESSNCPGSANDQLCRTSSQQLSQNPAGRPDASNVQTFEKDNPRRSRYGQQRHAARDGPDG